MAKKTKLLQILLTVILAFTLVKCAHQLPPTGGPVDTIPPEIIDTFPPNGTTNFSDDHIDFTFSEYVEKRSVKDAIFISPNIAGEKDFDWNGRTLEISFEKDSLLSNTTYSVTVGTDVKDVNHGNNMAGAFTLYFSTGAKIDKGVISGKVFATKPLGIMIFAYKESLGKDNPLKDKPNYISQVGKDGMFKIGGLSADNYKIIAVRDKFMDLLYNIGEDAFGVPFKKASITAKDSLISGVNFFMSREDTTAPNILDATMTDRNHVFLKLSEPLDSSKLSASNFYFYDSSSSQKSPINFWFKKKNKSSEYFLAFSDTLNSADENYLIAENIYDKAGNQLPHIELPIAVNEKPDTVSVNITSLFTDYNGKINPHDAIIFAEFSDAVDSQKAKRGIEVFDKDSVKQKFNVRFPNSALAKITLLSVKPDNKYSFAFNLNYFQDAAGNVKDTTYFKTLTSMGKLNFSGAEGMVKINSQKPVIVHLQKADDEKIIYTQKLVQNKNFKFSSVVPGKYLLWAFEDKNRNGKYDFGKVLPYTLSERFQFYSDTLNLRARWPVGDILLKFQK